MKKLIVLLMLVSLVTVAPADTCRFIGSGEWMDPTNWSCLHLPGSTDTVGINWGNNTITLSGDAGTISKLQIGVDESGTLEVNAGGSLTMLGGSTIGNNGGVGIVGTLTVNQGGTVNSNGWLKLGSGATGVMNVSGTVNLSSHLWMASGAGSAGVMDIYGGGVVNVGGMIGLGTVNASTPSGSNAIVNINNGGLLALSNIHPGGTSIQPGSSLNLYGSGRVTLPGDFINVIGNYAIAGYINGDGIPGNVQAEYDAAADLTTVTVLEHSKFLQMPLDGPRYFGHDELSTAYSWYEETGLPIGYRGCYMADDFADLVNTPVINVRWWGSYLENIYEIPVTRFLMAFETDIPAIGLPGDPDYVPSHPGQIIQSEILYRAPAGGGSLNPGEFSETNVSPGGPPCNETLFEYVAELKNPFPQEPDTVYWIKIVALVDIDPQISILLDQCGIQPCDLGQHSWQGLLNSCPELDIFPPITRWGWHNRDYTIMNPYASKPLAVNPGENKQGPLSDGNGVWHFQDDAVSGELYIDMDDIDQTIFIDQLEWYDEYYKYSLPYCLGQEGVDGPQDIVEFSKDLAFSLWTTEEEPEPPCFTRYYPTTSPQYNLWLSMGQPDCWCYDIHQCGDVNGDCFVTIADDIMPMVIARAGGAAGYDPCADANYDGFVTIADDIMTAINHRVPATAPHQDDGLDCLLGTCPTAVGSEIDGICDPVPSPDAILP